MNHITSKPEYWESAGLRMQIDKSFMKCKAKYSKMGNIFRSRGIWSYDESSKPSLPYQNTKGCEGGCYEVRNVNSTL